MQKRNLIIYSFLFPSFIWMTSCVSYKQMNQEFVKTLNSEIKNGEFEKIYSNSSNGAKNYKYSKEEFIRRLKIVRDKMKEIDESLQFQQLENKCGDEGVFRDDNYACPSIKNDSRRMDIEINLDAVGFQLQLLDLCVYEEGMDDKFCVSDASRS